MLVVKCQPQFGLRYFLAARNASARFPASKTSRRPKDEFKARGLSAVTGDAFSVTATEQIAGRLDAKAVRDYLGAAYSRFEVAVVSTVIRIKAANRTLPIAA